MKNLTHFTQQIWLWLGLTVIGLTAMAVTLKPVAPGIEVFFGEEIVANNHASFEIENGTDWETFYGVASDNDVLDEVRTYTIKNKGDAPLTIQSISLENLSDEFFSIVEEPVNKVLAPGEISSFKIGFTIKGYGVSAAKIGITTNDPIAPTYYLYMMANSIECAECSNPKIAGNKCQTCADRYNPDTFPACDKCRTIYMVDDCTACIFPGQDIKTYCNTCENPNMRWPRCYM